MASMWLFATLTNTIKYKYDNDGKKFWVEYLTDTLITEKFLRVTGQMSQDVSLVNDTGWLTRLENYFENFNVHMYFTCI